MRRDDADGVSGGVGDTLIDVWVDDEIHLIGTDVRDGSPRFRIDRGGHTFSREDRPSASALVVRPRELLIVVGTDRGAVVTRVSLAP